MLPTDTTPFNSTDDKPSNPAALKSNSKFSPSESTLAMVLAVLVILSLGAIVAILLVTLNNINKQYSIIRSTETNILKSDQNLLKGVNRNQYNLPLSLSDKSFKLAGVRY